MRLAVTAAILTRWRAWTSELHRIHSVTSVHDPSMRRTPTRLALSRGEVHPRLRPSRRKSRLVPPLARRLLLCDGDGCRNAYHIRCLRPMLERVPEEDWFCSNCMLEQKRTLTQADIELAEARRLQQQEEQEAQMRLMGHEWLGQRVTRFFGARVVVGTVTKWLPADEDAGDSALFRVVHDDGDSEDLEERILPPFACHCSSQCACILLSFLGTCACFPYLTHPCRHCTRKRKPPTRWTLSKR